jgi:hypothetical protein
VPFYSVVSSAVLSGVEPSRVGVGLLAVRVEDLAAGEVRTHARPGWRADRARRPPGGCCGWRTAHGRLGRVTR